MASSFGSPAILLLGPVALRPQITLGLPLSGRDLSLYLGWTKSNRYARRCVFLFAPI